MPRTSFAFLIGTGRCGSSLLAQLLCEHASVGYISGIDDRYQLSAGFQRLATTAYRRTPRRLSWVIRALELNPSEAYRTLGREVSSAIVAPVRDLVAADASPWMSERTRALFERRAHAQANPVFAHKLTGWPRAGYLNRVFPQARFVHLVRDGRAVANSLVQQSWWSGFAGPEAWGLGPLPVAYESEWLRSDRSFAVLAGLEWMMLMDAYDLARAEIPAAQWLEIRYEDLLAEPRRTVQDMLDFLSLDWDGQFEARFAGYHFNTDRPDAYRNELDPRDVQRLNEMLGGHLARLSYPVTRTTTPVSGHAGASASCSPLTIRG